MKKEEVYINLQGKTKEELTDLWEFLDSIGEKLYRDKEWFLECPKCYKSFNFHNNEWCGNKDKKVKDKQEVTIEQLKEILQPMELSLTGQLQKAEAEVKRLQSLIEEENKPKVGDWVRRKDNCIWKIRDEYDINTHLLKDCKKITNPELIKLIEDETNENNLFR